MVDDRLNSDSSFYLRENMETRDVSSGLVAVAISISPQVKSMGEKLIANNSDFSASNQTRKDFLQPITLENITISGGSLGYFKSISKDLGLVLKNISHYKKLTASYKVNLENKINNPYAVSESKTPYDAFREDREKISFASEIILFASNAASLYIDSTINYEEAIKSILKRNSKYTTYLENRFVKKDKEDAANIEQQIRFFMENRNDEDQNSFDAKYIKVKLYQDNPVLTDVLLQVIDSLPKYKESIKDKKRNKTEKILSKHAVEESAVNLAHLSNPTFLHYIENPTNFFKSLAETLQIFDNSISNISRESIGIISSEVFPLINKRIDDELIERALTLDRANVNLDRKRLSRMDLDKIVQSPDDVLPDNKTETDAAKKRLELFDLLYSGMKELSVITHSFERSETAKFLIEEAAKLKDELAEITLDYNKRKLRNNKRSDNEFYVVRKGQIGAIHLERKPAPEIKLEDVIGESFDQAKKHLMQIVETGEYSEILRLTSPRGKVKSNILLVGPYGCGKTELARALCGDKRVIGVSISAADVLTAYMHESVSNVKRIYDEAANLRDSARGLKPVILVFDEFNGWFEKNGQRIGSVDMEQIENIFLETLDGMENYNGIITVAMTNKLGIIPEGIRRRFRYIDVVGKLNSDERVKMIDMFLNKSLPFTEDIKSHYERWADKLDNAPGDVIGKVFDEVHFDLIPEFLLNNPSVAKRITSVLKKRERANGSIGTKDVEYIRKTLQQQGCMVTAEMVDSALNEVLQRPAIKSQIRIAKEVYRDATDILNSSGNAFGLKRQSKAFD